MLKSVQMRCDKTNMDMIKFVLYDAVAHHCQSGDKVIVYSV